MSVLDWILTSILIVLYLGCLITVCMLTFQKGYIALGIIGIFLPLLWLIGALLPAKPGSPFQIYQARHVEALAAQGGQVSEGGAQMSQEGGQMGPTGGAGALPA